MSLDGLPQQFEEFVERARAALSQEMTAAKNIIAAATAEKNSAQNAVATLEAQCKQAQSHVTVPDYVAIGVLVVLIVWAVADWFPRGRL